MPVPKLVKSVPFWASTGCVGVGGTGLTLWQTLGKSSDTSAPVDAKDNLIPQTPSISAIKTPTFSFHPVSQDTAGFSNVSWETFQAPESQEGNRMKVQSNNDVFGLGTYGCFNRILPKSSFRLDDLIRTEEIDLDDGGDQSPKLAPKPTLSNAGNTQACSFMNLQNKDRNFLFRSELVVNNDNFGFALWTGLKGVVSSEEEESFSSYMVHYLVFFERQENNWDIKGGYSWGGKISPLVVSSLTIKSPDDSINKTFSKGSVTVTENNNLSYIGVWEPGNSGSELINFEGGELSEMVSDQGGNDSLNIEFPIRVKGYKDSDIFYELKENKSWAWKKYEMSAMQDMPDFITQISSSVSAWTDFAKDKQGTWKTMSEYCKGKDSLDESKKSKSICYKQD